MFCGHGLVTVVIGDSWAVLRLIPRANATGHGQSVNVGSEKQPTNCFFSAESSYHKRAGGKGYPYEVTGVSYPALAVAVARV